jgi:alkane 1-monooxygenase
MVILVAKLQWTDPSTILASVTELLAIRILVGTNSCCSGIAVAHELIHRRRAAPRFLGRCVLATVCYAHFAVEHLRRHHRHVGTAEDPATARLGESYSAYWRRTKKEQFVSAWRLESARLGLEPPFALSTKLWRHEVFLGLVAEAALILGMLAYGGPAAAGIFLLQSLAAVRLLEAVNYFQHWGLEKSPGPETPFDAWVTDSWFSMHVFVGLARHSDHHRHGGKPYHRLDFCGRGPRLPFGYLGMALLAKSFNRRYQSIAQTELRRYRRKMRHSGNAAITPSHQGVNSQ